MTSNMELNAKEIEFDQKFSNGNANIVSRLDAIVARLKAIEASWIGNFSDSSREMPTDLPEVESLKDVHGKLVAADTQTGEIEESGVAKEEGNPGEDNMFVEMPRPNNFSKGHELVEGSKESSLINVFTCEEELYVVSSVDRNLGDGDLLKPPPLEGVPFKLVEEVKTLKELAAKLCSVDELAVELKHNHYRSFQGLTYLMQISTRTEDFVIDKLKLRIYIGPYLREVFKGPLKKKVRHGADRDIVWLQGGFGIYVCNLLDTGQALRVLKLERNSLEYLLNHFGEVAANKEYQNVDWRLRPLPAEMMRYAREDLVADKETDGMIFGNLLSKRLNLILVLNKLDDCYDWCLISGIGVGVVRNGMLVTISSGVIMYSKLILRATLLVHDHGLWLYLEKRIVGSIPGIKPSLITYNVVLNDKVVAGLAVFDSWNSSRAIKYRSINQINGSKGTAVNVQCTMLGNMLFMTIVEEAIVGMDNAKDEHNNRVYDPGGINIHKQVLEETLRTNCRNGRLWEVEYSETHIHLDTYSDTTSGLIRLGAQLQELLASDLEEPIIHVQTRWNNQRACDKSGFHNEKDRNDASPPFSPISTATFESQSKLKVAGLTGEICENGFQDAWVAALVVKSLTKNKFLIEYQNLRSDDDDIEFLREEADNLHMRSAPPEIFKVDGYSFLEEVDAFYNDAWWVGLVSKVLRNSKYIVFFRYSNEEMQFPYLEIRLHQEWIDGKWMVTFGVDERTLKCESINKQEEEHVKIVNPSQRFLQCDLRSYETTEEQLRGLVEPVAMLGRRMIKCNNATVAQVIVQGSSISLMDAMWRIGPTSIGVFLCSTLRQGCSQEDGIVTNELLNKFTCEAFEGKEKRSVWLSKVVTL